MPPKRKVAVGAAPVSVVDPTKKKKYDKVAADGSGNKRNATAVKNKSPAERRWEFEESSGKWVSHSDDCNKDIDDALASKKKSVLLDVDDESFSVKLDKLIQVDQSTKCEQNVRCCFLDDGGDWYSWQWDDSGQWAYHVPNVATTLENAYRDELDEVEVKLGRSACVVSLKDMVQRLKKAGTSAVRRMKSDAKLATGSSKAANGTPAKAAAKVGAPAKAAAKVGAPAKAAAKVGAPAKAAANGAPAKAAPKHKARAKGGSKDADSDEEVDVKTVVVKGKAPVDEYCQQKIGKAHVYCEGDDVWDAMLNQTNLQYNNNKFYIIQLLEDDVGGSYCVWFRWGRVGKAGQNSLVQCGSNLEAAKNAFCAKFLDKTKNDWGDRVDFVKVAGKYDLLLMDYSTKSTDEADSGGDAKPKREPIKIPESKLDARVKELVQLICNVKAMEQAVIEMKYDAKKAPLGKLTTDQIKAGYLALKEIESVINEGASGKKLCEACNKFYTRIPHNFGMKAPTLISTKVEILEKIQLLEALGDIQVALEMLSAVSDSVENPVDTHYKALKCHLAPLDKKSSDFKMIKQYLQDTHEKTHSMYTMELVDVFECEKEGQSVGFIDHGNRLLLWHGSRLTNWAGILKQGLRIAPAEAPVTGYMFGKGVYFADRSSKSANYCFTTKTNNTGILLLCEVSLGKCNELINANYNGHILPSGTQSVKGLGMCVPDDSKGMTLSDGTVVPVGKSQTFAGKLQLSLNYNASSSGRTVPLCLWARARPSQANSSCHLTITNT